MSADAATDPKFQIGHVLFIDIGCVFSQPLLPRRCAHKLWVATSPFQKWEKLISLPPTCWRCSYHRWCDLKNP